MYLPGKAYIYDRVPSLFLPEISSIPLEKNFTHRNRFFAVAYQIANFERFFVRSEEYDPLLFMHIREVTLLLSP